MTKKQMITIEGKEYEVESLMKTTNNGFAFAALQEIKEKKWPQIGDEYWYIGASGYTEQDAHDDEDDGMLMGNIYKTREQAQVVIDLKKHIYGFEMPKKGEETLIYGNKGFWVHIKITEGRVFTGMKYEGGAFMPVESSNEDLDKRKELLKAHHNG